MKWEREAVPRPRVKIVGRWGVPYGNTHPSLVFRQAQTYAGAHCLDSVPEKAQSIRKPYSMGGIMSIGAKWFVVVGFALFLAGCFVPEKFTATININKDGSYNYSFDGTVAHALVVAKAVSEGLTAQDEADLKQEAIKMKSGDVRRAEYLGNGRFNVLIEHTAAKGEASYFPSREMLLFRIEPLMDGTMGIETEPATPQAIRDLDQLKIKLDGTVVVKVADGVSVLKHNADSEPSLFGLVGGYKWWIDRPGIRPLMIVRPAL